jgi:hypothetical protein
LNYPITGFRAAFKAAPAAMIADIRRKSLLEIVPSFGLGSGFDFDSSPGSGIDPRCFSLILVAPSALNLTQSHPVYSVKA